MGEYYKENKEEKLEYQNKYYEENKKDRKKYYDKNKEKIAKHRKDYRDKNREKLAFYQRNKRQTDIGFKIACNLRNRMYNALKRKDKVLSTMFLIGCDVDYLMYYLQERFTKGMSWDNYGDWHIDHIKPCAKFNLSKPEEQQKCFHYSNLQPLWAIDNHKKSDK